MTLQVTRTGKAIAKTGLQPEAVHDLLGYFARKNEGLRYLLMRQADGEFVGEDDFEFTVLHALFASEEYQGDNSYHYLTYQLTTEPLTGPQQKLAEHLYVSNDPAALNAAILSYRWIRGTDIRTLETTLDIRSGVLTTMFGEAASLLRGLADILFAASSRRIDNVPPKALADQDETSFALFVGPLRALAKRMLGGLPEELLWMQDLEHSGEKLLGRNEIIALRDHGLTTPDAILDGGKKSVIIEALGTISAKHRGKANAVVEATDSFKVAARERLKAKQLGAMPECSALIHKMYTATGTDFEECVEAIWDCLELLIEDKDDATKNAFPDFIIALDQDAKWAVECKSKTTSNYVDFNDATDVIRKANTNGYRTAFKITVCQPFVATNVPRQLLNCDELCLVNADDLLDGAIRVKADKVSKDGLIDWLTTPGQATREFLMSGE